MWLLAAGFVVLVSPVVGGVLILGVVLFGTFLRFLFLLMGGGVRGEW